MAYRAVAAAGFFDTKLGERVFFAAYDAYKGRLEARAADRLAQWAPAGSTVIDVGANVGFFTMRFASWVGEHGHVIAFEPERKNIRRLRQRIKKANFAARVEIVEGVAAETSGTLRLALNPYHPGDHKIALTGIAVQAWTIDDLLRGQQCPRVSLIKIDVQGAEVRVLRGARDTITRCRPTLFVEVDDAALQAAGFSADEMFDELESLGYRIYDPSDPSMPLTRAEAAAQRRRLGYSDHLIRSCPPGLRSRAETIDDGGYDIVRNDG